MEVPKRPDEKKNKEDERTLAELSSAHRRSQEKCQLAQTSYITVFGAVLQNQN